MFDRCTRFHLDSNRRHSAYFALGVVGAIVGSGLALLVGWVAGYPMGSAAVAIVASPLSFLFGVKVSHLVRGSEVLVMSEKLAAALLGTAAAARILGLPVLATVDLAVVGIGAFLVFGRLGCAAASCCFGRPARSGLEYGEIHARFGFPKSLVGVPLFPIQLVESAAHALLAVGAVAVTVRFSPGTAVITYLIGYSLVRVLSEVARGDGARAIAFGLSETQWIAAFTLLGIAGLAGLVAALRFALLAAIVVTFATAFWLQCRRLSARQIEEIANALSELAPASSKVSSAVTPSGLILSRSSVSGVLHYAFSRRVGELSASTSAQMATLIALLTDADDLQRVATSKTGAHHFDAPPAPPAPPAPLRG